MAVPTILFNSSTGSDTAASGAGPTVALSGANAAVASNTTVTLSVDAPTLTGVATDGSACMWVDTSSGRQYSRITAVDNGLKTVTVATAYAVTEGTRAWGIGGKRATLNHADSRTIGTDCEAGWILEFEDDGSLALSGAAISISGTLPLTVRGNSLTTKRLVTQSSNVISFAIGTSTGSVDFQNLAFENTNGTKTNATAISVSNNTQIRVRNCRFGHITNTLSLAIARTAQTPSFYLYDCEIMYCVNATAAIGSRTILEVQGCYIHDNVAAGIGGPDSGGQIVIMNSVIENNGGDGILVRTATGTFIVIAGNTIHGNTGDGIDASVGVGAIGRAAIFNNNITSNGGYGIRAVAAENPAFLDFNNFGSLASNTNNTSGSMLNLTDGANDLAVDPNYKDAANGDFSSGVNIRNKGFPNSTRKIGGDPTVGTYGYTDIGIQRREKFNSYGINTGGAL
jgi:hypothetical protein